MKKKIKDVTEFRKWMDEQNLTYDDMAAKVHGVSSSTFQKLASGEHKHPTRLLGFRLFEVFGASCPLALDPGIRS